MAKKFRGVIRAFAACLLFASSVDASQVRLAWDASKDADVAGYKLSYGVQSGHFTASIDAHSQTEIAVTGLTPGTYYFIVQAYATDGEMSDPSSEVRVVIEAVPPLTDFSSDGTDDLLWWNSDTHQLVFWQMNGTALVTARTMRHSRTATGGSRLLRT